ncbi:hypothetical protein AMJ82_08895 [candidate division TA06 bacterium SM23_40]|uniref:Uncharacterized protein n=1 Tax=candidate division TA06 bacterium SM23_40 TaxID=1703774 RepID=A0A0S8G5Y8_UNCT6|nr:MAG: hypothetical protein AMJ82_08895 [candidate division TA06 bacterium SM23_40]
MPYTRFKRRGKQVDVYKDGKAFTSHSPSKAKAHKTAAMREMAEKGKLRVAKKRKRKPRRTRRK